MDRDSNPETPLKDYGSMNVQPVDDDEIEGHHTDRWQHQAMYVGLHFPTQPKKRKHKKHGHHGHHHKKNGTGTSAPPEEHQDPQKPLLSSVSEADNADHKATPPSERVKFLLGREDDDDAEHRTHDIFCEMDELRSVGDDGGMEWKETARWIKFEEDVEEGGERWSKPFVATLSLHSLFELRKGIMSGTVLLDANATDLMTITDLVIDNMVANKQMKDKDRESVQEVLLSRHRHQHDKKHHHHESRGLPLIRSLADIGKRPSAKTLEKDTGAPASTDKSGHDKSASALETIKETEALKKSSSGSHLTAGGKDSKHSIGQESSNELHETPSQYKFNEHFAKKIPAGAEASNILVGEVEFLESPVIAFVRLHKAVLLGDLTEVPVPTRFIFILLGPTGNQQRYHEIGRSIATLMSDEVFHEVAYKARNREDLLAGMDEFLDQVTVLPPGEWDPTIRIEPPKSVPSQEGRKKAGGDGHNNGLPNGQTNNPDEEEEHGDATLMRTGRLFGGLIQDVRRKLPFYASDFKDALHVQCIASFFFMYFACLTPIITFGGLLGSATDNNIAAMESLVSGAICGVTYHLFSGQPLTIIGSTGPVLVFETIVFTFCRDNGLNYLPFRCWIGWWMAIILFLMVMFDLSALVRYITRFTEESFAMLIALIFIVEAFKKLFHILDHQTVDLHPDIEKFCYCTAKNATEELTNITTTTPAYISATTDSYSNATAVNLSLIDNYHDCVEANGIPSHDCNYVSDVFFFSCILFIFTFVLSMSLKLFRNTRFFPNMVRSMISDFSVFISIMAMVLFDALVGLDTPKLNVPKQFRPTRDDRGWIIDPLDNPVWAIPAAILPALLATILIFMDQQITAVIVNRKEHKLLKGGGYHLDLLLIVIHIVICSLLGTPYFVAATVLAINHVRSLTRESETSAPGERPKFLGIREQRVTGTLVFIMVGVSALMAPILSYIPMPVLYGVFLFMGVSSVKGIQLMQRMLIIFMPTKYQPDYVFLRHVPVRRCHLFTLIQVFCLGGLWAIKSIEMVSIIFPLMVLAMCFIRKALDWMFTRHELKWLDDIMPESHKREKEEEGKDIIQQEVEQHIEMAGGFVNIPLKEGRSIKIPVDRFTYDPVSKSVNIPDEMSKKELWSQLAAQDSQPQMGPYQMRKRTKSQQDPKDEEHSGPVSFHIGHQSSDEKLSTHAEDTGSPPEIVVDPPSKNISADSNV